MQGLLGSDEIAESDDAHLGGIELHRELADLRAAVQELQRRLRESEEERERIIARERSVRAEAEWANRLKDQFLFVVSHELRAPVTTLLLWERVLREETLDPDARARALDAIHDSAVLQARLVGDLLDMSRALCGRLAVELEPVAVRRVLATAIDSARAAAAPRSIAVDEDIDDDLDDARGGVLADPGRLRQILDNLLSNAIKFTPPGGRVTVTARREPDEISIAVSDTGRGIEPELLPRLFEPFSQGGEPTAREGGLGLGLAIASELVALHGGTLRAFSDGRGRGARFELRLPRSRGAALQPEQRRPLRDQLRGVGVLVVDDDVRVLAALRILLERAGARVECASSCPAAWSALQETPFHVVLCDLAMAGEDGYALARRIREVPGPWNRARVVALTACASLDDCERVLAAGVDLHVAKPVDAETLITSIVRLLAETS